MNKEKTAGIICDNYKVQRFKRDLKQKGYSFKVKPGPIPGTTTIKVKFEEGKQDELTEFVKTLNYMAVSERR